MITNLLRHFQSLPFLRLSYVLALTISFLAVGCSSSDTAPDATASSSPAASAHASHSPDASMTPRVPAFRKQPIDRRTLPQTLEPSKFTTPYVVHSYRVAKEIPEVLAEQPCYCYCDAGFGHGSLLDCHIDAHSAECGVCAKETILAEQLYRQGKTSEYIRQAIIRGDWQNVELK